MQRGPGALLGEVERDSVIWGVHGGVHHPCLGGAGRSRSQTRTRLLNPCVQAQTPHGDGLQYFQHVRPQGP